MKLRVGMVIFDHSTHGVNRTGWVITHVSGPEDPRDPSVNDIIDSEEGEDSEEGFDDMPYEAGWDDGDFDPEDEEDEDE